MSAQLEPRSPGTATDRPSGEPANRHRPDYEVYAVKYAQRAARRPEHFIGGDPHDEPMDMDYFVWAIIDRGSDPHAPGPAAVGSAAAEATGTVWVVDTGFDQLDAVRRDRELVRTVTEGLLAIGVEAASVDNVILTHLHYDHVGGFAQFPAAAFHLQDREMSYASGRYMAHHAFNHAYTPEHIAELVHLVYRERVVFHDGDAELAPGLSVHLVGGHTMGLQVVRVATRIGWLVLASDASHYYENMETGRPFPIAFNVGDMLEAYARCNRLATDRAFVVPGHDPRVFDRYPPAKPGLDGVAVRLDVVPAAG